MSAELNRSLVRRILAGVLLAIILGTASHRHGNAAQASSETAIDACGGTGSSSAVILTDCSICKLHHQLSTGLIHKASPAELPLVNQVMTASAAVPYEAPATLSARGRAPPVTSPIN